MADITVKEITYTYPTINLDFKEKSKQDYDFVILGLYTEKCGEEFKVKKIYKTNKQGTKVKYEVIKDKNDFADYIEKVKKLVDIHKIIEGLIEYLKVNYMKIQGSIILNE
ncbi:hypothetical protein [Clostridium butyricum]|uniref:hypothetical protein n=1 Tax=Clostridium butyricum TaxID=1492 RepID=UPI00290EB66D|nr:hypothetical protein [Clostridium butyricum]MDU5101412.1 hypothetical protein [Clostridium butyricum]